MKSLISITEGSIGEVLESLWGVNSIEEGVLSYPDFYAIFYRDGDKYFLFNHSPLKTDVVILSFPTVGQQNSQTIMIENMHSFDVTQLFKDQAALRQGKFRLAESSIQKTDAAPQSAVIIPAFAYEIPVGQKRSIGSYMDVTVQENQVLITSQGGIQLQHLHMLTVQRCGDSSVIVMDIPAQNGEILVHLPKRLLNGSLVSVEIVVSIGIEQMRTMLANQANDIRCQAITDDIAMRINKAPKLNF